MDYESHSVTQPSLVAKLAILDGHLNKLTKARKPSSKRGRGKSNGPGSIETVTSGPANAQCPKKTKVGKELTQSFDIDQLSKLEAVDILSVLKRLENLERLTKKRKNQDQSATKSTISSVQTKRQ